MASNRVYADNLKKECTVFCFYLIRWKPNGYILKKYQEGQRAKHLSNTDSIEFFDKLLINLVRVFPRVTKIVDVYTRVFYINSVFRKKIILLLAILESCSPTYSYLDTTDTSNKTLFYLKFFYNGILFLLILFISVILLMPIHLTLIVVTKVFSRHE